MTIPAALWPPGRTLAKCIRGGGVALLLAGVADFLVLGAGSTGLGLLLLVVCGLASVAAVLVGAGMLVSGADREFAAPMLVSGATYLLGLYLWLWVVG